MATIEELPFELLYYIILLLVQSPGGAADFARILSVCRKFLLFAEDEHILKIVNFDIKMEFKNVYRYQHVNSLLVKCSEAGNVAARFFLGKVILVSSSQLLPSEWPKVKFDDHPCDFATLSDLSSSLATNVPAQNRKVGSFMNYFLPKQVSTSEFSQTTLVHYQLVKLFLLNCSPDDFIEMDVFLMSYFRYFTGLSSEYIELISSIRFLVCRARRVRAMEKLAKTKESFIDSFKNLKEYLENSCVVTGGKCFDRISDEIFFLVSLHLRRCDVVGVSWREAINDMDFLEELRTTDMRDRLDEAYSDFYQIRAKTIDFFEHSRNRFGYVMQNMCISGGA